MRVFEPEVQRLLVPDDRGVLEGVGVRKACGGACGTSENAAMQRSYPIGIQRVACDATAPVELPTPVADRVALPTPLMNLRRDGTLEGLLIRESDMSSLLVRMLSGGGRKKPHWSSSASLLERTSYEAVSKGRIAGGRIQISRLCVEDYDAGDESRAVSA